MDLFDAPNDSPSNLANALDKQHEKTRLFMKKGKDYLTLEKRAANLLRWYASNKTGPKTVQIANEMLSTANDRIYRLEREINRINTQFLIYVIISFVCILCMY